MRRPLIAGNWKMHGRLAGLGELALLGAAVQGRQADVLACPPASLIAAAVAVVQGGPVLIGGQDCSDRQQDGAFTGEISAAMLAEAGARFVIVGHSERRARWGESDALVRAKAEAGLAAGLVPIICVGESEAARREGQALAVVGAQLRASVPGAAGGSPGGEIVIAYEPNWAVGTDRIPSPEEIEEVHAAVRSALAEAYGDEIAERTRILYGGSVNPTNGGQILAISGVDGALVGRASLKAAEFSALIALHPAA